MGRALTAGLEWVDEAMETGQPQVSVVIPTRNRTEFLGRAIESALAQTLWDIEVIVVIDGEERDESLGFVRGLSDQRVRSVVIPAPVGGSEARNIGVQNARADWIALLDDDDEWLPEKLERQKHAAETDPDGDRTIVTCRYLHRANDAPDVVRPRRLPKEGEAITEFIFDYLCHFQTSTFFCSKDLITRVPFTRGLPLFQDIDWFLRAMAEPRARLELLPEILSIYTSPVGRKTIISGARWETAVEWGHAHRHLMSRRAYSGFIVGSCAGRAVQQKGGLRVLAILLYECMWKGSATPKLVLLLCGAFCISPELRVRLRDRFLLKRANDHEAAEIS